MHHHTYRPCVGIALFNRDGMVFVGRRRSRRTPDASMAGHQWQMPQGGIDLGELPQAAALRELQEETNVSSVSFLAEAPHWLNYDLPTTLSTRTWKGRYKGQTQKWFAFRFEGNDSEIDILTPGGGQKPEFEEWRWERLERLPELIIPFKRDVYEEVVGMFRHLGAASLG